MEEKEIISEIEQIENKLNELARKYKLKYTFDFEENFICNSENFERYYPQIKIDVCKIIK